MAKKYHRNKIAATALAASVVATAGFVVEASAETPQFKDIAKNGHESAIKAIAEKGFISGFGDGTFRPNESLTRGQAAKIIAHSAGIVIEDVKDPAFKDISTSHMFYKEIAVLKEAGIINGYSDNTFRPEQTITRGELAKLIAIAAELAIDEKATSPFEDVKGSFFAPYIAALYQAELTNGTSKTTYKPTATVTRGEMSTFALRTFNYIEANQGYKLTILHTNDTHSRTDLYPKLVTAVNEQREANKDALLIDAGDVFAGTLYFSEFEGQADVKLMNYLKYDVMTLGNHEFDLGASKEGHKALADFIQATEFPFVSANVDASNDELLKGLFSDLISSDPENGKVYQGMVKEVNGEKIGFFGLTTAETEFISSPVNVKFNDYIETAKKAVAAFEKMGINKIVAVTHIGYDDNANVDNDLLLAEHVDGIDIIVGGHSHTELKEAKVIAKDEPTVIVQASEYLKMLGKVDVTFDENGVVKKANGQLIELADFEDDAKAVEILKPFKDKIKEVEATEIGVTLEKALETPRDGGTITKPSVRKNETILGNIIADGMLQKAKEVAKTYDKKVVMALTNGGGIRASIDAGPVTVGDVRTVLTFGNTLAMMDVTGKELRAGFEHALSQFPKENGGFLHIAGGKVEFDYTKPVGQKVVSLAYKNEQGEFVAIKEDETYTVATNAFTAKGGDGFTSFGQAYASGRVTDFGITDWENFRDYLISIKDQIPTEIEGRVVNVSKEPIKEPELPTISVKDARATKMGENVKVKGIITGFAGTVYHLTDGTASIALYNSAVSGLSVGDEVTVSGSLGAYKNTLQLGSFSLIDQKKGAGKVEALELTGKQVAEEYEAAFASVSKVKITADNGSGNYAATTADGGSFVVRAIDFPNIVVGQTYDLITGHIQQVNNDYVLIVGNAADIVQDNSMTKPVVSNQVAKLIAAGSNVQLSSATKNAKIYYTTDGSTPTTKSTLYKDGIKVTAETTIKAIAIADGFKQSDAATFAYKVYDPAKGLQIHDLQGESHESPLAGSTVENIVGVVTGTYELNGGQYFYLQTPDDKKDNNPNTSEAIVVYAGKDPLTVKVGNLVKVAGKVSEYYIDGSSSKSATDLSVTQLNVTSGKVEILEQAVALPAAIKVSAANLNHKVIENDRFAAFDPKEDAMDFWESLEGMRIETGSIRVTAPSQYGEFYGVLDEVKAETVNGGMLLTATTSTPTLLNVRLYTDSASKKVAEALDLKTGDKFTGTITGHVNYGYSNYKMVVNYEDVKAGFEAGTIKPETKSTITFDENKLTIGTYNVENFSANSKSTTDEKVKLIANAIVNGQGSPDIIGLVEMQDNDGEDATQTADASKSFERLIAAIKAAGGPEYKYINIDPVYDKDGGAPGANIRPGFLYNPARVTFNAQGTISNTAAAVYENGKLAVNPSLIDPTNASFTASRKPIVAQFTFKGEEVLVIGNHWNSKSGDLPVWGKVQPVTLASEKQRVEIAHIVGKFVKDIQTKNPNANIVALGDFNDFQWTPALKALESYGLYNKINDVPSNERYTYTYQGNSQVLDHILVSNRLKDKTVIDILNVNADFTEADGRASDHNPLMIQIDLRK